MCFAWQHSYTVVKMQYSPLFLHSKPNKLVRMLPTGTHTAMLLLFLIVFCYAFLNLI